MNLPQRLSFLLIAGLVAAGQLQAQHEPDLTIEFFPYEYSGSQQTLIFHPKEGSIHGGAVFFPKLPSTCVDPLLCLGGYNVLPFSNDRITFHVPVTNGSPIEFYVIALNSLGKLIRSRTYFVKYRQAGHTYFVDRNHPQAADSNPGTESLPWRTIVHGASQVDVGDTLFVKRGTYRDGNVVLGRSGQYGREIVLAAYPGHEHEVVIVGAGIRVIGKSHYAIHGFKVLHAPNKGIHSEGPSNTYGPPATNIWITGNYTHDTHSSGISIWGTPWQRDPGNYDNIADVVVEDNLLELGTNGGRNEIITVANGASRVDVRYNTIRIGDPNMTGGDEGIDFKEGVRDSRIFGNLIYDLSDKAIYIDGGSDPHDPQITNIHIFNNIMYDLPSAGVSIVTEGRGDVNGVYVYNNLVYGVDGNGLMVYDHPGGHAEGGTVKNVYFINNTVYDAGRRHGGYGGIRIDHPTATGIVIRNNIAYNNNGFDIRGESGTTIDHNFPADPHFVNTAQADFRLQSTSPAIDRGNAAGAPSFDLSGANTRPRGWGVDIGTYEFRAE